MDYDTWKKIVEELQHYRDAAWELYKEAVSEDNELERIYVFGRFASLNDVVSKIVTLMINEG